MCTPELPNPMPAKVAASIMLLRASRFDPSCTAVRNEAATSARAFSLHRSEIGLDPQ